MTKLGFPPSDSGKPSTKRKESCRPTKAATDNFINEGGAPDIDERIFRKMEFRSAFSGTEAMEISRQVSFAIEHGALKDHERNHALNICMKLLRERRWDEPIGYQFFLTYGYAPKPGIEISASTNKKNAQSAV